MKISVLITTYGENEWAELALSRAYPSVEDQGAHEIIVRHYPVDEISQARNMTASEATGDHLLYLDADDELAPGYVAAMEQAISCNPGARVLFTPAVQQIRDEIPGQPFFFPECDFRTGNWIVIGTLIKRDFFHEVGGFDDHPHGLEDFQLWAKCAKAGARVVKVPDAVYRAYWNRQSKHHILARNRSSYRQAYETARASVWG